MWHKEPRRGKNNSAPMEAKTQTDGGGRPRNPRSPIKTAITLNHRAGLGRRKKTKKGRPCL